MEDILQSNIVFKNNKIESITVLVEFSKGDIRAIQSNTQPKGGYFIIPNDAQLNDNLLQEVAGYVMEVKASSVFKNL